MLRSKMTLSDYFKFSAKITKEIIKLGIVSSTTILRDLFELVVEGNIDSYEIP